MAEGTGDLGRAGELIAGAVAGGRLPGAVAAAGRGETTLATWVAGQADTTPGARRPMTIDTVFDLASLTKVVATTTAVLALVGQGRVGLDDPVTRYLPGFMAGRQGPVTIRQLLTHTSGLPAMRTFYQWCATRGEVLDGLLATPLEVAPGTRVAYSDLGFMLLGEIVAAVTGAAFDVAVGELVTGPLGLRTAGFNPGGAPGRFAATERRADGTPWVGVVHDENARAMGGVAGHAGLFGRLADLTAFATWWVSDADGPVPVRLRRQAGTCATDGLGGRRGLGWTCRGDRYDILGVGWPDAAVSHTGFTGTSLGLDSGSGLWVVLLTNGVHFGRDASAVKALRRNLHTAVAAALLPPPG
ncbi:MAG TPA: serine hydrolase domain-containing protein [Streptosporangiaceae bacterium]